MLVPEEYVPGWLQNVLAGLFGAGSLKAVSLLLENRRIGRKEFRETLLERINHLEEVVSLLQDKVAREAAEIARLRAENAYLKLQVGPTTPESGS